MNGFIKAGSGLLVAGLLLSGCGSSGTSGADATPTPTPTVMTKADAAARYLAIVCPGNAANDALNAVLTDPDLKSTLDNAKIGDPIPEELKVAWQEVADAQALEATQYADPLYIWPAEVQKSINTLAKTTVAENKRATLFATPKATFAPANKVPKVKDTTAEATQVRKALGLPPPGKGCPTPSPTS